MKRLIFVLLFMFLLPIRANAKNITQDMTYVKDDKGSYIYVKKTLDSKSKYATETSGFFDEEGNVYYCVDPLVSFVNENRLSTDISALGLKSEVLDRVKLIMYYGYGYDNRTSKQWIIFTNILIWREIYPDGNFIFTSTLNGAKTDKYDKYLDEILNDVTMHYANLSSNLLPGNVDTGATYTINSIDLRDFVITNCENCIVKMVDNNALITFTGVGNAKIRFEKISNRFSNSSFLLWYDVNGTNQRVINPANPDPIVYNLIMFSSYKKADIEIIKKDLDTNEVLEGVKYCLYNSDYVLISCDTTNEVGSASFNNLDQGLYYYKEDNTLDNYILDDNYYKVEVDGTNSKYINYNFNEKKSNVILHKYDEDGVSLENVKFSLYYLDNEEWTLIQTKLSDENGLINFANLLIGSYYLIEVETIDGYLLNDEMLYFTIEENNSLIELEVMNYMIPQIPLDPEELGGEEEYIVIEVPDTLINVFFKPLYLYLKKEEL